MEENDRRKILDNINALIKHTKYDKLVEKCLPPLLFPHMIEQIEKSPNSQWHRLLIQKITTRGPTAFKDFLKILEECEFFDAFRVLSVFVPQEPCNQSRTQALPKTGNPIKDRRYFDHLEEFKDVIQAPAFVLNMKNSLTLMEHHLLPTYSMKSRNRGVLFLVNNIDFLTQKKRNGAETDRVNLVTLFRALGFIIYYYENLGSKKFNDLVNDLIQSEVLLQADCLVFGILTHGDEENYAVFVDEARIHVEDIIFKFNNRDCPSFRDKPKIFLFPFCRGTKSDLGIRNFRTAERDSMERQVTIPKMSDMLICYGSVPGFATLRDVDDGSWYIQDFCTVLAQNVHLMEFEEMLKILHETVNIRRSSLGEMQTPYFQDREFNKILYFNPGCYED